MAWSHILLLQHTAIHSQSTVGTQDLLDRKIICIQRKDIEICTLLVKNVNLENEVKIIQANASS